MGSSDSPNCNDYGSAASSVPGAAHIPAPRDHAEPFALLYGLEYGGTRHFDGAIRVPTVRDREIALEEAAANASDAQIDRHVWARTITRLGDIPPEKITAELLESLVDTDYGPIARAEAEARKKLLPVRETPAE